RCRCNDNSCACFSVRPRIMVSKGDTEVSADIREGRWVDVPDSAGKLDGAVVRVRWYTQTCPFTTRVEHRTVKTRIMCGEKLYAVKPGTERRPHLPKCWRIGYVIPRDAMHIRKHKVPTRRTNIIEGTIDNHIAFDSYHCDRTRTIA